jgi:two-component system chemotaxis sensor kinase CheA
MGEMDDVIKEFLVESYENLDRLDRDFVALESDPTAADRISSIFRTIHTIKGTCGFLGFGKLESVAHVGENLLVKLRDRELVINADITTGLLKLVDAVREILGFIETTGAEGDGDYTAILDTLRALNDRSPDAAAEAAVAVEASDQHAAAVPAEAASQPAATETECEHPAEALPGAAAEARPSKESSGGAVATNAIRVDVALLDKLMNLVGELVLARNQVLQFTATQKDSGLINSTQRLNLITSELQESVMKTRMQPISGLWNKFPRVVRDLSQSCHKKVRIEMEGRETELDKTIIEAIKDPLTHIIRNSVDHGIEAPADRIAKGKPEEGCLFLRAYHEGGQVNIEIRDDGKGIDPERIKQKAVEKGLISAERAERMGEREAMGLIFLPGFSTAEKVTNVSGRGVGMDVVKTNVEKIGGIVDMQSKPGEGTTLRIKIPLTLAIIPALIVTSGGERFAIPQVSLVELVRVEEGEGGIEMIRDTPMYRLRGNLLPLAYLNRELKIEALQSRVGETSKQAANIVVLRGGESQFGLVVDDINDTEEIVVKPLGKQLKGLSVFAGATIMGDGKVALILDVMGFAQRAHLVTHGEDRDLRTSGDQAKEDATGRQVLLLCMLSRGQRAAIPLSVVERLEEFGAEAIEVVAGQEVVQYRGQIMPLVDVGHHLHPDAAEAATEGSESDAPSAVQVAVYLSQGRFFGLRVHRIFDVVEESVALQETARRPGVVGAAIIKDKVTQLLDIAAIVRDALPPGDGEMFVKEAA